MTMTAAEVREALTLRWPEREYVHVAEAPQSADRQGRKIDVLVMSMWRSRGHELDAVEVKVSASDWKRELDNAGKADWWWSHVHRFWIAVPDTPKLVERVRSELPSGWGLLACAADGTRVIVKAERHTPKPMPWEATIGLIRAAADAGPNALARAEQRGRTEGYKSGEAAAKRRDPDEMLRIQLEELRAVVSEFETASGISITERWGAHARHIGKAVAVLTKWGQSPEALLEALEQTGKRIEITRAELAAALAPEAEDTAA
jgi:hypothetical protein